MSTEPMISVDLAANKLTGIMGLIDLAYESAVADDVRLSIRGDLLAARKAARELAEILRTERRKWLEEKEAAMKGRNK